MYPWGHQRRFNSYSEYFRKHYGERVQKLSIDAGFTCPNRDGTVGYGGCAYCNNDAFNPSYCQPEKSILQQIQEGIEFHKTRYRRAQNYLAYFQAYSNTYASLDRLKAIYDEALSVSEIVGVVIGTRPDCIDEEKLEYLAQLSRSHYVLVEYGIESCYNQTLERINRGHTYEQCVAAIHATVQKGIRVGTHLIFGLPGESRQEMLDEVNQINLLPIDTIKFHQLQIAVETAFAKQYAQNPQAFELFGLEEYIDFMVKFLERLRPDITVERFASEMPPRFLVSQAWGLIRNVELWRMLEHRLEELNTWQGRLYAVKTT